jgi:hypothetical protein
MTPTAWKQIAAFGVLFFAVSLIDENLARYLGVATLTVLLIQHPDVITNPFGKRG